MRSFLLKINRTSQRMLLVVSFLVLAFPWIGPATEQPFRQTADATAAAAVPSTASIQPAAGVHDPEAADLQIKLPDVAEPHVVQLSRSSASFGPGAKKRVIDEHIDDPAVPYLINKAEERVVEAAEVTAHVETEQPALNQPLYVAANRLNLRSQPSTESEIIVQLKFGDQVVCQAELDGWVQVLYNDQVGYLSADYISWTMVFRSVRETVYVSARRLNLRAGPSTEDEILMTLRRNDRLARTGIGDGWSKVQTTAGTVGYVASGYITKNPPVTERTATEHSASDQKEIDLFVKIVALESHPKYGYDGYLAVATVIMNRVASSRYPGTITRVVSQPGQFSVYTSTRTPHITDSVRRAVKDALDGKRNLPAYVLFFATPEAYRRNVARKGVFSKLEVYKTEYGHVWCYYAADR